LGYVKRVAAVAIASIVWIAAPDPVVAGGAHPRGLPIARQPADPTADLAEQQARLDEAVRVVEEIEAQVRTTAADEQEAASEIERLEAELTRMAVDEYMDVGAVHSDAAAITSDPETGVKRRALVKVVAGDRVSVLGDLRSAKDKLSKARTDAEATLEQAELHRGEMDRQLTELKAAQERKAKEDLEKALAAQRERRAPSRPAAGRGSAPAGGGMVSVGGIVVHGSIASNLEAMLGAADAAGVNLNGSGYRDPEAQRRLRQQNCPNPVSSPASACSPPTAKPGQSMHEQGLAIDFTYNGSLIRSRSSPGFTWLAANAPRYGFANLPSEPWHWSVNGE